MTRSGRVTLATLAVAGVTAVALTSAPAAHAAAYRYWAYWQGDTQGWHYATAGAGSTVPIDGQVEGWRLSVGGGDAPPLPPGVDPSFFTICGDTPERAGTKRIAVVVDPGPAQIAPEQETPPVAITQCVQVPADASGFEVLQAATTVRTHNGFVCGIDGYPASECSPAVDDALLVAQANAPSRTPISPTRAAASPSAPDTAEQGTGALGSGITGTLSGSVSGTPAIGLVVLALVAALGWWQWKRRRG
jgi:hypothetical protein